MFGSMSASNCWRQILQLLLIIGIVAPAWFAGGIHDLTLAWTMRYFALLCGLILTVPHLRGRLTWLFPLLGLGLLLGGLQLLDPNWTPPENLSFAKQPYERLVEFTAPLREGSNQSRITYTGTASDGPVSLDVTATRKDLSILFLCVAACYACSRLFAEPRDFNLLCSFLALNGAALSAIALIQRLGPDTKFLAADLPVEYPFATFVNRNNGGGYLAMCLAGAFGWFIYDRHQNAHVANAGRNYRIGNNLSAFTTAGALASITCIVAITAGIASSLSRGAWLATGVAMFVVLIIASTKHLVRGWSAGLLLLAAVGAGVFAAQSEAVQARFASVESGEALENIRLAHWQDAYRAAEPFREFGSGLGTYHFVAQPQDTLALDAWFMHAENQYLETLITAGIPGLVLLTLAIVIAILTICALLSRNNLTLGVQVTACVGAFALITQIIHGGLDFGLYRPANALILAAVCGGVAGTLGNSENRSRLSSMVLMPRWAAAHPLWCLVLFAGCLVGSFDVSAAAKSTALQEKAQRLFDDRDGAELDETLAATEQLIKRRRHDASLRLSAARLSTLRYRLRSRDFMALKQPNADIEVLWDKTNPVNLFAAYHRLRPELQVQLRKGVFANQLNETDINNALSHLRTAIRESPLDPLPHLRFAKLSFLNGENGQHHVEIARRLAPSNPRIQFQCGLLEYSVGRIPNMLADWKKTLQISVKNLNVVTVLSLQVVDPDQFVERVLPDDPRILLRIAREYGKDPKLGPLVAQVFERIRSSVDDCDLPAAEQQHLMAQVEGQTGRPKVAAEHFERAIEGDPHKIAWRYDYAVLLEQLGRFEEALEHARWCVRQSPRNNRYRNLLNRVYTAQSDS